MTDLAGKAQVVNQPGVYLVPWMFVGAFRSKIAGIRYDAILTYFLSPNAKLRKEEFEKIEKQLRGVIWPISHVRGSGAVVTRRQPAKDEFQQATLLEMRDSQIRDPDPEFELVMKAMDAGQEKPDWSEVSGES